MSQIISISGEPIPEGKFNGFYEAVGGNRDECIAALTNRVPFAVDYGPFEFTDSYTDHDGIEIVEVKQRYLMMGGTIILPEPEPETEGDDA